MSNKKLARAMKTLNIKGEGTLDEEAMEKRDFILETEDTFNLPPADLKNMNEEEIYNYIKLLKKYWE